MTAQREWFEKDYYKVLGVSETATAKEITKAYRQLARDSHPDTHPGDAAAEERFKAVSTAYDVLGDDAKRKEYDEVRRYGPSAAGGPGGFQQGDGNFSFNVGGEGLSDEQFEQLGGNRSITHVDFMIGSPALDIDGVLADGTVEPVMRAGTWAQPVGR